MKKVWMMKTNKKEVKKMKVLLLVLVPFIMGCISTPNNVVNITDLSIVPEKSKESTLLEGTWRLVKQSGKIESPQEYTFSGNQFTWAGLIGQTGNFLGTRGIINLSENTLELYCLENWEDFGSLYYLQWESLFKLRNDKSSIGLWINLPVPYIPARIITYTFSVVNDQLIVSNGKASDTFTRVESQVVLLEEATSSVMASSFGLDVGENESIVIIWRQTAKEAKDSKNSRINNDFEIRIDGKSVTTIGKKSTQLGIQLDSVYGTDNMTVLVIPDGTHTLDIFGRANRRDYSSNAVEFNAKSSVTAFNVIWKGLILPNLILNKAEEIVFNNEMDKMIRNRF